MTTGPRTLTVLSCGPGVLVQDLGRPNQLALGVSRGGVADRLALHEGAALVGNAPDDAGLEIAGLGAELRFDHGALIAVTGAAVTLMSEGASLPVNTAHLMPAGAVLRIGPARAGTYAVLSIGGGITTPRVMGARAVHTNAGIGGAVTPGTVLPLGPATRALAEQKLTPAPRLNGGTVRVIAGLQTALFPDEVRTRFEATPFTRHPQSNRMAVRLSSEGGAGFALEGGLNTLSEAVIPGDIQVAGDGTPYVLFADCQTTGGYPRIGSVLTCDLPVVVQASAGAPLRFHFVSRSEALSAEIAHRKHLAALPGAVTPRLRDPAHIADLLSYQLVDGAVRGDEHDPLTKG